MPDNHCDVRLDGVAILSLFGAEKIIGYDSTFAQTNVELLTHRCEEVGAEQHSPMVEALGLQTRPPDHS